MTDTNLSAESWSKYWTQASGEVGCLPGAPKALGNLLDGIWSSFGSDLDEGSKVLDLACGNGVVGASVRAGNPSVQPTGVDYANLDGIETADFPILGSTSITDMPLDDGSFDAAVSQFGIEYADASAVGKEIRRVVSSGAKFQFIVHHTDSAIISTNQKRREILIEINGPVVEKAVKTLDRNGLQKIFGSYFERFDDQELVLELANAVRAMLSTDKEATGKLLTELKNGMTQECRIIDALEQAAIAPDQLESWQSSLGGDFKFDSPRIIELSGDILCWDLSGTIN